MTMRQFAPIAGRKISVWSPFLVGSVALALFVFSTAGLSEPYIQFDLTAKIQSSLHH